MNKNTPPDNRPVYTLLTGPDNAEFCERVSEALAVGYKLHGSPAITFNGQTAIVAQAVIWPSHTEKVSNKKNPTETEELDEEDSFGNSATTQSRGHSRDSSDKPFRSRSESRGQERGFSREGGLGFRNSRSSSREGMGGSFRSQSDYSSGDRFGGSRQSDRRKSNNKFKR